MVCHKLRWWLPLCFSLSFASIELFSFVVLPFLRFFDVFRMSFSLRAVVSPPLTIWYSKHKLKCIYSVPFCSAVILTFLVLCFVLHSVVCPAVSRVFHSSALHGWYYASSTVDGSHQNASDVRERIVFYCLLDVPFLSMFCSLCLANI